MVLYTARLSILEKMKTKMKIYYVVRGRGNDVVVPDQPDLEQYRNGVLTWPGFRINYWAKLMKPEAEEWMKTVSEEAITEDVVLVSDEEDAERSYRILLAERLINLFSGHKNVRYAGELKV